MTLKEYLDKYGISISEFARRAGVNPSSIWHYFSGRRRPSQRTAEKIEAASDTVVKVKTLRGKDERQTT